jgi:hypothetical protein
MRPLFRATGLLVVPLALLLFAQWPLRDLVQAYSRQANDAAQIFFALYMAVAVTAASRAGTHLSAGHAAATAPRWRAWATAVCVLPWAAFMLWVSAPVILQSMRMAERFPETDNPGFFIIKASLGLMLALVIAHALTSIKRVHG